MPVAQAGLAWLWNMLFWGGIITDLAWRWYCVARGVAERTFPTTGRMVAILLIPATAVASIAAIFIFCTVTIFSV